MTTITQNTVTLSQNPDGSFLAQFSDGVGFNFVKADFWQFLTSMDRELLFFFVALQAFVSNNMNPQTSTLSQIKALLQAQTYPGITT